MFVMSLLNKLFNVNSSAKINSNFDFPNLNQEALKQDFKLVTEALTKTKSDNYNLKNDAKINEIKIFFQNKIDEKNHEYRNSNVSDNKRFNDLEVKIGIEEFEIIKDEFSNEIAQKNIYFQKEIAEKKSEILKIENQINLFKHENNITRPAIYPTKRAKILSWLVMAVLIIAETIFSGMFFAKGNEMGIVGGVAFAGMISFIVVLGASLFIGFFYKLAFVKNGKNKSKKYFFTTIFVSLILSLIAVNFLIAHHREEVASLAITNISFAKIFTPLHEFDSILLIIFNLFCLGFCSYKIYHLSEPFLEYEKMDKLLKKLNLDLTDTKNNQLFFFDEELKKANEKIDIKYKEIGDKSSQLQNINNREKKWLKSYPEYVKYLEENANFLIKFYAEQLQKNGNKFNEEIPIISFEIPELEPVGINFQEYIEKFKKEFQDAKQPYLQVKKTIAEIHHHNFKEFQNYI